jgi:hypothetical protein
MMAASIPSLALGDTGLGERNAPPSAEPATDFAPVADRHGRAVLATPGAILVPGMSRPIEVKIASTRSEYEQAFQLLAARYQARGYEEPSAKLFRFTPYHVLPDTVTFVAKDGDEVVTTFSLVPDTTLLGLPMECIYGREVESLRREGRRIAEVTSLADRGLKTREFIRVFTALIALMKQYHVRQGGDTWVITVNPRHRSYYRKVLGYVPLGPRRTYPTVRDNPAEAFLLDVEMMMENAPAMFRTIFGEPLPDCALTAPTRPADHARYFGEQSTQTDRRMIAEITSVVEHFGSPPRWKEEASCRDEAPTRPGGRLAGYGF